MGQIFVGDKGMILSDHGRHVIVLEETFTDVQRPAQSIPKSIGHHHEWVDAIKNDKTTTCNLENPGALIEAVMLGVVSFKSQQAIEWDAANLKLKNDAGAQLLIHIKYRKGWTL